MVDNPISQQLRYRQNLLNFLPTLQKLDNELIKFRKPLAYSINKPVVKSYIDSFEERKTFLEEKSSLKTKRDEISRNLTIGRSESLLLLPQQDDDTIITSNINLTQNEVLDSLPWRKKPDIIPRLLKRQQSPNKTNNTISKESIAKSNYIDYSTVSIKNEKSFSSTNKIQNTSNTTNIVTNIKPNTITPTKLTNENRNIYNMISQKTVWQSPQLTKSTSSELFTLKNLKPNLPFQSYNDNSSITIAHNISDSSHSNHNNDNEYNNHNNDNQNDNIHENSVNYSQTKHNPHHSIRYHELMTSMSSLETKTSKLRAVYNQEIIHDRETNEQEEITKQSYPLSYVSNPSIPQNYRLQNQNNHSNQSNDIIQIPMIIDINLKQQKQQRNDDIISDYSDDISQSTQPTDITTNSEPPISFISKNKSNYALFTEKLSQVQLIPPPPPSPIMYEENSLSTSLTHLSQPIRNEDTFDNNINHNEMTDSERLNNAIRDLMKRKQETLRLLQLARQN